MGLQIGDIVPRKSIELKDLKGKKIAVDAFNTIYQFLSIIRQPDGTPLMDKEGNITSHLSGLFYRNINLLQEGIKLIYVFDGKAPELKKRTQKEREEIKQEAKVKFEEAKNRGDVDEMRKYAQQLATIDERIIKESKELLEAMGIAVIQAPGEGEAQAAYLAKEGKVYAVASQDYDSLLFQTPKLIQNLTLSRRRRTANGNFVYISPEIIELQQTLNTLQINLDQLICLGILIGTDYNPGGIKGIGPKKALEIVKKYKQPVLIFKSVEDQMLSMPEEKKFDWKEIFELFHKPNVANTEINFPKLNEERVKKILLDHDFSPERIDSALEKLRKAKEEAKQTTLF